MIRVLEKRVIKAELVYVLQRYCFIAKGIANRQQKISFYVGNRKEEIVIDDKIKTIFAIIDDVIATESPLTVTILTLWLKQKYTDERIIMELPLSRSVYYRIKGTIVNKIYQCCILRGLVTYEELLKEQTG